jgi:two-component system, chemotaxis family, chemotaxis protein CheY
MGLNILVVDDSSTMRAMLAKTLQMTGLPIDNLHKAANGQEGLDILDEAWVDVVLIDLNMPVMGGLEMIAKMRETPDLAGQPVIVVSSESSQTRIDELRSQGLEFIHKPFTPEQVRDVIQKLLGDLEHAGD